MVLALILIVIVLAIRKHLSGKMAEEASVAAPILEETPQMPDASGSAGQIKLHNVEPKTAAMLMAIVADKMGKPLNELRFISIKKVE